MQRVSGQRSGLLPVQVARYVDDARSARIPAGSHRPPQGGVRLRVMEGIPGCVDRGQAARRQQDDGPAAVLPGGGRPGHPLSEYSPQLSGLGSTGPNQGDLAVVLVQHTAGVASGHGARPAEVDHVKAARGHDLLGVGPRAGIVIGGQLVHGAQDMAGNTGHIAVPGNTTPCVCGNVGCLDAVAGGRALVARLRDRGLEVRDVPHLVSLASDGVPAAAEAIRAAGRHLGEVLAYAVNLLNPDVVAFWGYLADAEAELLAGVRESVYQRSLPSATKSLQLVRTRLGQHAGVVGGAMIVISEILRPSAVDDYLVARARQSLSVV